MGPTGFMNAIQRNPCLVLVSIGLFYAALVLATLYPYGNMVDECQHFILGDMYFKFWTTMNRDYLNFTTGNPVLLESRFATSERIGVLVERSVNYPQFPTTLASATSYILHDSLGLMDEVDGHHAILALFGFACVVAVGLLALSEYGLGTAVLSQIVLILFIPFFGFVHGDIKDAPVACFYPLAAFLVLRALKRRDWGSVALAGTCFGLGLAMRPNIAFLLVVAAAWLFAALLAGKNRLQTIKREATLRNAAKLGAGAAFALAAFVAAWPYLIFDPLNRLLGHVAYFTNFTTNADVLFFGQYYRADSMPLYYASLQLALVTPPFLLALCLIGIAFAVKRMFERKVDASTFFMLWLAITLLRVSNPYSVVYGGIRLFVEAIPAMALLSGFGCYSLYRWLAARRKMILGVPARHVFFALLAAGLAFTLAELLWCHPFEAVYYSPIAQLASGPLGPGVENNFVIRAGNYYRIGALWLNENAEPNATLVLPDERVLCTVAPYLRSDIRIQADASQDSLAVGAEGNQPGARYFIAPASPAAMPGTGGQANGLGWYLATHKPVKTFGYDGITAIYLYKANGN